ncbi:MAG: signal peptidase I [Lachnospiraceae bacterium]|nr:signal peptidase I [Lachnospiraceae bacterium]
MAREKKTPRNSPPNGSDTWETSVGTSQEKGNQESDGKRNRKGGSKSSPQNGRKREPETAERIIRRRRMNVEVRRGYRSLVCRAIVLVFIGWLLLTQFLLITQAPDNEMFPAIEAGDLVIAYRLQATYSKNDVVVYTAEGSQKIGRVIAREGDVVTMDDTGTLLVNGTVQSGEILFSTYAKEGITYPYVVPEDSVFILCDYRTSGTDSRDYGAIALDDVEGKVITILRRRSI